MLVQQKSTAENKYRNVPLRRRQCGEGNIKVGGWAGALAGASYGASVGVGGGTIVPGAGNVVGGIGGGIIGGIIGYCVGSTATQIFHDYLFTKGVSAK